MRRLGRAGVDAGPNLQRVRAGRNQATAIRLDRRARGLGRRRICCVHSMSGSGGMSA
jgi:hypothetical protein